MSLRECLGVEYVPQLETTDVRRPISVEDTMRWLEDVLGQPNRHEGTAMMAPGAGLFAEALRRAVERKAPEAASGASE